MRKLKGSGTVTGGITRIMLLALGLLLWQTQAMAQVDSFLNAEDIKASVPSTLERTLAAKARQGPPPDDDDVPVETAFVFLFADVPESSDDSDDSDSASGSGSGGSGLRQEQEVLWYVGLIDPVLSEDGRPMQVSETPAAIVPPAVTADGSLVAFVRAEDDLICLVDMQTGEETCDDDTPADNGADDDAEDGGTAGGGSAGGGSARQAASPTGTIDVALSPDGSLLAYVPLSTGNTPTTYFVVRDIETGEEFPVEFLDDSGQPVLQDFDTVDFSESGMEFVFDAMAPFADENGETMILRAIFVWDLESGEIIGWGSDEVELRRPAFGHASDDYLVFEAVSGEEEEEMTTGLIVADLSQDEIAFGGMIMSLPPAWPGFGADDMSLYFLAPIQDAETGVGIASIPVDLTVLEPAGDPELVMMDAIFGDAYAAGGAADDDDNGTDDDNGDDSNGDDTGGGGGAFPF